MDEKRKEEGFTTIHLERVKAMLGLKGRGYRTVLKWCNENKVPVIGSGKRQRILESDWIRVNKELYIKKLRLLHPSNWEEILKAQGIESDGYDSPKSTVDEYVPKSRISRDFMRGGKGE